MTAKAALRQRGRSEMEALGTINMVASELSRRSAAAYAVNPASVGTDGSRAEKVAAVEAVMAAIPEYRYWSVLSRWGSENSTPHAVRAFEAARADLEPGLKIADDAIETVEGFEPPPYWKDFEFHLTRGGWDGHDHMGFIHHELVYGYLIAPGFAGRGNGDITAQRRVAAQQLPWRAYRRILDIGCATGRFTEALSQVFPAAQITGVDPSISELRYAARWAADHGRSWRLRRASGEATGFPAGSFDLVAMYIVVHELPPAAVVATMAEAFRVLEPGGHFLSADIAPYRECDAYRVFVGEWEPRYRNEPWWRTTAELDFEAMLTEAGFVDVREYGLGPGLYPWVVMGTKP